MTVEFRLPDLGEDIDSGDVVNVLVAVGDTIAEDQPVIELETDKAVIEVPSSVVGTISAILVAEGDKVGVGQAILSVEADAGGEDSGAEPVAGEPASEVEEPAPDPGHAPTAAGTAPVSEEDGCGAASESAEAQTLGPADVPAPAASPPAAPPSASGPVEFALPDLGEDIDSGDVVNVLVAVGDSLAEDQPVIELETDKAVIEVPSTIAGSISAVHVQEGDRATVGQAILTVEAAVAPTKPSGPPARAPAAAPQATVDAEPAPTPVAAPAPSAPVPAPVTSPTKLVPASPTVRRLAREIGVDITHVLGSGPGGRISEDDVKTWARQLNARAQATPAPDPQPHAETPPLPDFGQWGQVERVAMNKVRRLTAERMSASWSTIPHVTQFDKADTTDVERWRKEFGKRAEAAGGKLTPTAIILKIAAAALKAFPQFNASVDAASSEIVYKKYCHIGVAVDTDRGLLVPVIRDVDQKNIIQLAVELTEIARKARDRKIVPDDMQGGCFTISNLGGIGGTGFTPIINAPEVAILGVARSQAEPVLVDGQFQPRLMLPLSLSYDHRVIDGADGARFLRWMAEALENPFLLVLEG